MLSTGTKHSKVYLVSAKKLKSANYAATIQKTQTPELYWAWWQNEHFLVLQLRGVLKIYAALVKKRPQPRLTLISACLFRLQIKFESYKVMATAMRQVGPHKTMAN